MAVTTALIGCGGRGVNAQGEWARQSSKLELVAVCDLDDARRNAASERLQAPGVRDFRELLARPDLQSVLIATNAGAHALLAAEAIKGINIDLFFLSTGTWNMSRGVTTPSMDKVEVKLAALQASTSCFLLADSTKFGTVSRFRVTPIEKLDAVITDEQLPQEMQANIRDLGVTVHVAEFRKPALT